jgi:site-specific DNA-methyltransferase (adenine-specific)
MGEKIRNKTIKLTEEEIERYIGKCYTNDLFGHETFDINTKLTSRELENKIINYDTHIILPFIQDEIFDLIIVDPPYNIDRQFDDLLWKKMGFKDYIEYLDSFLKYCVKSLKSNGTIYLCGDWKSSAAMQIALATQNGLTIQNRITWSRDKGRGAKTNYKNNMEDIWFATKSKNEYTFNVEDIKLKKKVIAPYKDATGNRRDWEQTGDGKKWRLTYPSNIITDCTVPYWSMAENTEHPTQKPEKLMARLILASSNEGDFVFDPFGGSGTTAVVASKLNRKYCSIEMNRTYCAVTQYRLEAAQKNNRIQGYDVDEKCFLERNYNDDRA